MFSLLEASWNSADEYNSISRHGLKEGVPKPLTKGHPHFMTCQNIVDKGSLISQAFSLYVGILLSSNFA